MWQILEALFSGASAVPSDKEREAARAIALRPGYGILAAIATVGCVFAAIINSEWDIRLMMCGASIVMAMWTLACIKAYRQRKKNDRIARGQCAACGYDLRGTPERCPECGKVAQSAGTTGGSN